MDKFYSNQPVSLSDFPIFSDLYSVKIFHRYELIIDYYHQMEYLIFADIKPIQAWNNQVDLIANWNALRLTEEKKTDIRPILPGDICFYWINNQFKHFDFFFDWQVNGIVVLGIYFYYWHT